MKLWAVGTLAALAMSLTDPAGAENCGSTEGVDPLDPLISVDTHNCDDGSPVADRASNRHISNLDLYFKAVRRKSGGDWTTVLYLDGDLSRGQSAYNGIDNRGAPVMTELRLLVGDDLIDLPVNNSRWQLRACPAARLGTIYSTSCVYRFFGAFKITDEAESALAGSGSVEALGRIVFNTGEEVDVRISVPEWQRLVEMRGQN